MEITIKTCLLAKWDMDVDSPTQPSQKGGDSPQTPKEGIIIFVFNITMFQ